jgi:hypothetical protein
VYRFAFSEGYFPLGHLDIGLLPFDDSEREITGTCARAVFSLQKQRHTPVSKLFEICFWFEAVLGNISMKNSSSTVIPQKNFFNTQFLPSSLKELSWSIH